MAVKFRDIFNRESQYPIFSCLCDHLEIGDILALSRTCKRFASLYEYLLPIKWNVEKRLQRFVRDPTGLRSKMGELDVLISGSFAIQSFQRVTWLSSDLDLYVEDDEESDALCAYLVESEGYTLKPTKDPGGDEFGYALYSFVHIWRYVRPDPGRQDHFTEIQVITAAEVPIHAILNSFYTTVVVNIISWNKAYSVYPMTTFIQKRGYLLQPLDDYSTSLVIKYTNRGWKIQETMWPEDERLNHPIQQFRRIGDRYTWTILLNIRLRARQMTAFEFRKLKADDRPPSYQQMVEEQFRSSHKLRIDKPSTWNFWDSEIPQWYKAWEKTWQADGVQDMELS
ncbi:MAG: hypothetical protein Q9221_004627 [Calogaya cf. arnoldii]